MNKRLKEVFYPIANVLAPIPSIVFAPYVIRSHAHLSERFCRGNIFRYILAGF